MMYTVKTTFSRVNEVWVGIELDGVSGHQAGLYRWANGATSLHGYPALHSQVSEFLHLEHLTWLMVSMLLRFTSMEPYLEIL